MLIGAPIAGWRASSRSAAQPGGVVERLGHVEQALARGRRVRAAPAAEAPMQATSPRTPTVHHVLAGSEIACPGRGRRAPRRMCVAARSDRRRSPPAGTRRPSARPPGSSSRPSTDQAPDLVPTTRRLGLGAGDVRLAERAREALRDRLDHRGQRDDARERREPAEQDGVRERAPDVLAGERGGRHRQQVLAAGTGRPRSVRPRPRSRGCC